MILINQYNYKDETEITRITCELWKDKHDGLEYQNRNINDANEFKKLREQVTLQRNNDIRTIHADDQSVGTFDHPSVSSVSTNFVRALSDFDNLSELNYNNNDNFLSTAPTPSNEFPHNSYNIIP